MNLIPGARVQRVQSFQHSGIHIGTFGTIKERPHWYHGDCVMVEWDGAFVNPQAAQRGDRHGFHRPEHLERVL